MDKLAQAQMYYDFLRREGYDPEIDDDGDVIFRDGDRVYLILIDEKDEEFFRLVFPNFWSITSQKERERVERAALHATAMTKVAKVFPVRNNVWATVEMFVSPIEGFMPVFERSMRALNVAVHSFVQKMREEDDDE
ncbi:MAG: hypothetical protein NZ899_05655 [Thermoguttaceae bacterium]|nr:hypothetical protein [Thermoguttaceae bacterium]MDW8079426.1 hypothetical protein [Thermoguttaceae bacterium]